MELKTGKYTFEELREIIRRLRRPDGCPWDREQTHVSLKKNLIEEAYEAAEAFDGGDGAKMADELGDVLLQVMLHSQIGEEAGEFTVDDVIDGLCRKMIVRHPHVFGSETAQTSEQVLGRWDRIKREERGQKTLGEEMEGVSRALPALLRGGKLYKKAARSDFDEIPKNGGYGYKIFLAIKETVDAGLEPEEELAAFLEEYINFVKKMKKFEENT